MPHKRRSRNSVPSGEELGPLEWEVLEILWQEQRCSVRDVVERLPRARAYTTVMTTLSRLFAKGLVKRSMCGRRFLYAPRLDRQQVDVLQAQRVISSIRRIQEKSRTPGLINSLIFRGLWEDDPQECEWLAKTMQLRLPVRKNHRAEVSNGRRTRSRSYRG